METNWLCRRSNSVRGGDCVYWGYLIPNVIGFLVLIASSFIRNSILGNE